MIKRLIGIVVFLTILPAVIFGEVIAYSSNNTKIRQKCVELGSAIENWAMDQ
jgi:hypothetical protein